MRRLHSTQEITPPARLAASMVCVREANFDHRLFLGPVLRSFPCELMLRRRIVMMIMAMMAMMMMTMTNSDQRLFFFDYDFFNFTRYWVNFMRNTAQFKFSVFHFLSVLEMHKRNEDVQLFNSKLIGINKKEQRDFLQSQ